MRVPHACTDTGLIEIPLTLDPVDLSRAATAKRQKNFFVRGYAATMEPTDSDDYVITRSCFDNLVRSGALMGRPTLLWNHDKDLPCGLITDAGVDGKGLWVEAKISRSARLPRTSTKIIDLIQDGVICRFSLRGRPINPRTGYSKKLRRGVRLVDQITFSDVSLVSTPGDIGSNVTEWFERKLDPRQRQLQENETMDAETMKRALAYLDSGVGDPAADVIAADGTYDPEDLLRAVPEYGVGDTDTQLERIANPQQAVPQSSQQTVDTVDRETLARAIELIEEQQAGDVGEVEERLERLERGLIATHTRVDRMEHEMPLVRGLQVDNPTALDRQDDLARLGQMAPSKRDDLAPIDQFRLAVNS